MTRTAIFVATLWTALLGAWAVSGEQFLDLVFAMPNAGVVDDAVIAAAVRLEEARAALGVPDLFQRLRDLLHGLTGLG